MQGIATNLLCSPLQHIQANACHVVAYLAQSLEKDQKITNLKLTEMGEFLWICCSCYYATEVRQSLFVTFILSPL